MGQIYNIESLDKKFIALGNREMLIRRIYWPMEEFLKGEQELTIGMICAPINNYNMSTSFSAQSYPVNDNNSFYFGLRSVKDSGSYEYERLPYASGSAFIGMKNTTTPYLLAPHNYEMTPMAGRLDCFAKNSNDSTFSLTGSNSSNLARESYFCAGGCVYTGYDDGIGPYPKYNTRIATSFKYNPLTNTLYIKWAYHGKEGNNGTRPDYYTSSSNAENTRLQLLNVMNYDAEYFKYNGSATSSIDLTKDDVMNFFVFWPFTTARLAIQAYGWQLT
jgi:hypothetical protein